VKIKLNTQYLTVIIIGLLLTTVTGSVIAEPASNLEITNLSGTSINLSHEDLQAMPTTTVHAELYCDGSLATYGNWTGILLSDLLNQAQLTTEVSSIHSLRRLQSCDTD
jgi:DMSO/TMAO reductase YedYZ molybdopterin-dependent catalytic subunit